MRKILQLIFALELSLFVLSAERIPNPSVINGSPFAKFNHIAGRNKSTLFETLYEPLLNNPRWIYAPFMKDALTNWGGKSPAVAVSKKCKSHVLKIIENFPATYTIECKYKMRNYFYNFFIVIKLKNIYPQI